MIVLGFNGTLTLVDHFVSSQRKLGRKEIEEIVEEMKEMEREAGGTGMKMKQQKK